MFDLPFSTAEFLGVFARYNRAIGAATPVLLTALAVIAVLAAILSGTASERRRVAFTRVVFLVLASLWLWSAFVYLWGFFRAINSAAPIFALLFTIEGDQFLRALRKTNALFLSAGADRRGIVGALIAAFALAGYPLASRLAGHAAPFAPTFGTPCPVVILTLGLLLWLRPVPPLRLLAIPLLWTMIGTLAALQLGMREDLGLLAAGILTVLVLAAERVTVRGRVGVPRSPLPAARRRR